MIPSVNVNFDKWWWNWAKFQSKQKEAEKAVDTHDFVLYGGAAGGGKSYFLRKYPIKFLIRDCFLKLGLRGVRVGLFCEDFPALWERHISRLPYEFPGWLGTYRAQQHEYLLNEKYGGGVLAFRNLDDPSKYVSSEFALQAVDELTKNPRTTFDDLRHRLRWPGIEHPKFVAGTNPGGIGHAWVRAMWIDGKFGSEERMPEQFFFIPARVSDNKFVAQTYVDTLKSLPEQKRKALLDGSWDLFEGQYFPEWSREVHVVSPFAIPSHWKRFRSYDHGRENPAACGWYALDGDGNVYKYREFYERGLNVDEIARGILDLSGREEYEWSVADPSIFAKTGMVDAAGAQTIAESFLRCGIAFLPGSNRRIDRWELVHRYLANSEGKPPKLRAFSNCLETIRTIPSLIHDKNRPEDLDTDGEDHAADELGYFLAFLHEAKSPEQLNPLQKKLQERMRQDHPLNNEFYFGGAQ